MDKQYYRPFSLASDNTSGVHPAIMQALADCNRGYATAYGEDAWSEEAEALFKKLFGREVAVFLVMNGTGANVAALSALVGRSSAIVCPSCAHINTHETGAGERLLGAKLLPLPHDKGKLAPETLDSLAPIVGDFHAASPDVLSISNTTELGSVYTQEEVAALCDKAHAMGMKVHMDGARFANAVAALDCTPDALTGAAGVDVLCFGGTKNGFMFGEAIVFFDLALAERFAYLRKQYLQLASKGRFVAAQFIAALKDDLWLEMGRNGNAMAQRLGKAIAGLKHAQLVAPVESNQIFASIPPDWEEALRAVAPFLFMEDGSARFVTSFDTQAEQIESFIAAMQKLDA